eukprot:TRINITY_DN158_c1_g2_i1.p3 TRINITY_DN158_c1_g2~~TRINITY_DN158_c1_g2_i1.p3  ORF type:complete len:106 (+),score=4.28 TRINITY_DN158_c1_g2_i1:332-649(+)
MILRILRRTVCDSKTEGMQSLDARFQLILQWVTCINFAGLLVVAILCARLQWVSVQFIFGHCSSDLEFSSVYSYWGWRTEKLGSSKGIGLIFLLDFSLCFWLDKF